MGAGIEFEILHLPYATSPQQKGENLEIIYFLVSEKICEVPHQGACLLPARHGANTRS